MESLNFRTCHWPLKDRKDLHFDTRSCGRGASQYNYSDVVTASFSRYHLGCIRLFRNMKFRRMVMRFSKCTFTWCNSFDEEACNDFSRVIHVFSCTRFCHGLKMMGKLNIACSGWIWVSVLKDTQKIQDTFLLNSWLRVEIVIKCRANHNVAPICRASRSFNQHCWSSIVHVLSFSASRNFIAGRLCGTLRMKIRRGIKHWLKSYSDQSSEMIANGKHLLPRRRSPQPLRENLLDGKLVHEGPAVDEALEGRGTNRRLNMNCSEQQNSSLECFLPLRTAAHLFGTAPSLQSNRNVTHKLSSSATAA